ncbi:hypothetical protein G9F31_03845 [Acinetobacter sp. 187]|uniref:PilX N-terminal domain-containing pilus assembly protein n=1 Tax=Acinetobacter lanii TaxID=2715163 RepID=UPI00140BAD2B|nr:PilX N-terminal domain-containing pilus assembly protein [Acinetobacter lanii]NHC02903.1 hypothetical protein [Acinetobacter lanii]
MSHSLKHQQGVTLITTLIVLLLVTVIGTLAVRYAMTGLKVSTNSQVKQILIQSADTPFFIIRNMTPQQIRQLDNVIGLALSNGYLDREYVFCYRPKSQKNFAAIGSNIAQISPYDSSGDVITEDTMRLIQGNNSSFCSLTTDFGSGRDAVVTQVAVSLISNNLGTNEKGQYLPEGTNASGASHLSGTLTNSQRFRVTTTAMLPSYSTAKISQVQAECLSVSKPRLNDNNDHLDLSTLGDCISEFGIPVETQTQEFNLGTDFIQVSKPT